MRALNLCFQLHRPYEFRPQEEWADRGYFGGEANFREANRTTYGPLLALLERSTQKFSRFKASLIISGVWLEQAEKIEPDIIRRLRRLVNRDQVELILTPYYHSLSLFYDEKAFEAEIEAGQAKLRQVFGIEAKVLALPEFIYNDRVADFAAKHGFIGVLGGTAEQALDWRTSNQVFEAEGYDNLRLLFQNTKFSQAIREANSLAMEHVVEKVKDFSGDTPTSHSAKKRSSASAAEFVRAMQDTRNQQIDNIRTSDTAGITDSLKFSARKFQKELELESLRGELINLYLDADVFGRFGDDGIVRFFDELIAGWLKFRTNRFVTASEALLLDEPKIPISIKSTIDWEGQLGTEPSLAEDMPAIPDNVYYLPPLRLKSENQEKLSRRIFGLREKVEKIDNDKIRQSYHLLTGLDYLADDKQRDYEKILQDFEKNVEAMLPQPIKITASVKEKPTTKATKTAKSAKTAQATNSAATDKPTASAPTTADKITDKKSSVDKKAESDTPEKIEVKIHRNAKKSTATSKLDDITIGPETIKVNSALKKPEAPKPKPSKPDSNDENTEVPVHRILRKKAPVKISNEQPVDNPAPGPESEIPESRFSASYQDLDEDLESNFDEDLDADMDEADAAVQVLAQRLSRKQEEMTQNLDELEEAELVIEKKSKKRR